MTCAHVQQKAMQSIFEHAPQPTVLDNNDDKGFVESCLLCGVIMTPDISKRRKRVGYFNEAVHRMWKPSTDVWMSISDLCRNVHIKESIALCMPCMHWTSRCVKKKRYTVDDKSELPMDKMIRYCISPGYSTAPDERIIVRFMHALRGSVSVKGVVYINPYAELFPSWALRIIVETDITDGNCMDTARTLKRKILSEWWRLRGYQAVLENRDVATNIRRELHDDIDALHRRIQCHGGRTA